MPIGVLLLVVQIGLAIHAYRTGRMYPWLWILIFVPAIGSLLYVILEVAPDLASGRMAHQVKRSVADTVDPGRQYRALSRNVEIAPTVQNKLLLGEECLRLGRADEAKTLFEACASGLHADDPAILGGLARSRFMSGDLTGARAALETLMAENPGWRPTDVQLLYARILESQGEMQQALATLRSLAASYPGEEARCRYAELLARTGDRDAARAEYEEIVRRVKLQGGVYRKRQAAWYDAARRALA